MLRGDLGDSVSNSWPHREGHRTIELALQSRDVEYDLVAVDVNIFENHDWTPGIASRDIDVEVVISQQFYRQMGGLLNRRVGTKWR